MLTEALKMDPVNVEALFYRGVAYLDSDAPQKALQDLNIVLDRNPDYKKSFYIVLSIAYRRVNDYISAIRTVLLFLIA